LTIGRLADEVEMRKSSLYSLFGSREDLQLATFEAGIQVFVDEVWSPVADSEPGRDRLLALCDSWISFFERGVLPGGCFMTTATVEFDARGGPLHDAASRTQRRWLRLLERDLTKAIDAGDLPPGTDAADTAFQLNALAAATSLAYHLARDPEALDRGRRTMRRLLGA
jgi:AcrR family transcriptional regulator